MCNSVFTLPQIEPDTVTDTDKDTDKLAQNSMRICIGICLCFILTSPHNSVHPIFIGLCIGPGTV